MKTMTTTPAITVQRLHSGADAVYVVARADTGEELARAPTLAMAELIQATCAELVASGDSDEWGASSLRQRVA